jgi:hypothetical protein
MLISVVGCAVSTLPCLYAQYTTPAVPMAVFIAASVCLDVPQLCSAHGTVHRASQAGLTLCIPPGHFDHFLLRTAQLAHHQSDAERPTGRIVK